MKPGTQEDEATRGAVGTLVRKHLPRAKPVELYGIKGWVAPVPNPPPARGTMPSDKVAILLARRKAGWTLHVWSPISQQGFAPYRAALESAGYKVMVGCLQFNRKAPLPMQPLDALLAGLGKSLRDRTYLP